MIVCLFSDWVPQSRRQPFSGTCLTLVIGFLWFGKRKWMMKKLSEMGQIVTSFLLQKVRAALAPENTYFAAWLPLFLHIYQCDIPCPFHLEWNMHLVLIRVTLKKSCILPVGVGTWRAIARCSGRCWQEFQKQHWELLRCGRCVFWVVLSNEIAQK